MTESRAQAAIITGKIDAFIDANESEGMLNA